LWDCVGASGPIAYSRREIAGCSNLFRDRAALFFTPTSRIPDSFVGNGRLRAKLPIPTATFEEVSEIRGYGSPQLWVDLLQRATGKVRWSVKFPAVVEITRFDSWELSQVDLVSSVKALLDALKCHTFGRADGRLLYYFGAIADDDAKSIELVMNQQVVASASKAHTLVVVKPAPAGSSKPSKRSKLTAADATSRAD
jgi:hypothetical protein